MSQSLKASATGLHLADQARKRRGWTKTCTARWWQDAHTSRATLRRFWRGERIQQEIFIAICQTVGIADWQQVAEWSDSPSLDTAPPSSPSGSFDWNEAPDVDTFYDRTLELQQLSQWLYSDHCKLITINGPSGIGKTALALAWAEQVQPHFERLIWRCLQTTPNPESLLEGLQDHWRQPHSGRQLLIIDGFDALSPTSTVQEAYFTWLRQISQSRHQNCVLVTSRLPLPATFQTLPRSQSLALTGLTPAAALSLLQREGSLGDDAQLLALAHLYGYHPLALKIVLPLIQTLFGGLDTFLKQHTLVLTEPLRAPLKEQFCHLSLLEKDLLFWLAIWQAPISFTRLQTHLLDALDPATVMEAVVTLARYALIEKHFPTHLPIFTLPPMVRQFVTEELIQQILQEFALAYSNQDILTWRLCRSHGWLRPGTDDILGDRILRAVREQLCQQYSSDLTTLLTDWLEHLQAYPPTVVGYAGFNLATLLKSL